MSNFDLDDFSNDFNDLYNQAKEAANAGKNNINHKDLVNQAKEVGKNWVENLDTNMRRLANTAKAACNLLSGEKKEQCEKGAENSGMTTQVFDKIFKHLSYRDKNAVLLPNFDLL